MKTLLIFFIFISLIGCVSMLPRKERTKECVELFVKLDVPIKDATKACKDIYDNPYSDDDE